ncbi:MAG: 6,7-dimethyl-8-ribityllumazine synthase [Bacteroidota bacterium]
MTTLLKNLSDYDPENIPSAEKMKFGIVVSEWNSEITEGMYDGAYQTLIKNGAKPKNIFKIYVPGSFELTFAGKLFAEQKVVDAVIALGCVVQGETRHFDFICQGITQGITELNLKYDIPFVFGILTTENQQQARDRSGGIYGNKGDEAAITAIKMIALKRDFKK